MAEFHEVRRDGCRVFADNFTSTNPAELTTKAQLTDGVIVKPDQKTARSAVRGSSRRLPDPLAPGLRLHTAQSKPTPTPLIRVAVDLGIRYLKIGLIYGLQCRGANERAPAADGDRVVIESLTTIRHSLTAQPCPDHHRTARWNPSDTGRSLAVKCPEHPGRHGGVIAQSSRAADSGPRDGPRPGDDPCLPTVLRTVIRRTGGLDRHQIAKYRSRIHYLRVGDIEHSLSIRPEVRHSIRFVIEQKNS